MKHRHLNSISSLAIGTVLAINLAPLESASYSEEPVYFPSISHLKLAPSEQECLAKNIYFEARGESRMGQLAVAYVTINRVGRKGFAANICGVVYQDKPCQFSWVCGNGDQAIDDRSAWRASLKLAKQVIEGKESDPTKGALYYQTITRSKIWAPNPINLSMIDHQMFFNLNDPTLKASDEPVDD